MSNSLSNAWSSSLSNKFGDVEFLRFHELTDETTAAYTAHYRYNNQLFSVLFSTTPPEGYEREEAIEPLWIDRLWDLSSHFGDVHAQVLEQVYGELEIAREIKDLVFPTFQRLVPGPSPAASELGRVQNTVAEYLFPHRIALEVVTKDGKLEVLSGHHRDLDRARVVVPWDAVREAGVEPGSVPTFDAHHVSLGSRLVTTPAPPDVFNMSVVGMDHELVGKVAGNVGALRACIQREIEIYGKLNKLDLHPEARFPEFKGLITHNGDIVGFLIAKIPTKYPSLDPIVAGYLQTAIPALSLRRKWAAQIEQSVTELHRHGLVWGDAKPDNIVIDTDDNVWVLDFGGGGTPGWMDHATFQTMKGDLNAVAKMKERLLRNEDAK
ncbi:hypothetical protein B0I37DRAFT_195284 [Chaetomium sp. MPI-CAGE-AT-0009]|nr:hypothetical protein B0I37DRAFT_195284 [Chaetomium sp. MPI-CAGE-AT-0009]